ncbi:MAG: recombinase family protein [Pseudobutyrivibrio sp.]|nr:recombinase family protein [Pseudobutyrivibrio sp.]
MIKKTKVYIYTRVSTSMQTDGYSLDAQRHKVKSFAEYNDYEIAGEYEDAGISGKSTEGRNSFNQMIEDIKSGKDGVSYVLVFKLSRFGRNAADVLSTLQVMQDYGVNLICVEDGIDSSKDSGKLIISVLSAVAEIERENIRVQTMEGRIQKAREGKWNGGFAPYGYSIKDNVLHIEEDEAEAVRLIFDLYANQNMGATGICKYLENHGISKKQRQNGKNTLFSAHFVRMMIRNPVYYGKMAYGRRKTEKVLGTRNDYHIVPQDEYLLVDGQHEGIVSEELWMSANKKMDSNVKKYEHEYRSKTDRVHLLSGVLKCPVCGAGMYVNKSHKRKKDGTYYKEYTSYGCKHRDMSRGHKCTFRSQVNEELMDAAVIELITAIVSRPKFANMLKTKINMKVDTDEIDKEIEAFEKQLRQQLALKTKLLADMDLLNPEDKHYDKMMEDMNSRLYKLYDRIDEFEDKLIKERDIKASILADKMTADNLYKVLTNFKVLFDVMDATDRHRLVETLISEIQIYPEKQPNGQWLKSVRFTLPVIDGDNVICLDKNPNIETVVLLSQQR